MNLDERLFLAINGACDGPVATTVFGLVTRLGDGLLLALLILPPLIGLDRSRWRAHVAPLVLCVALGGVIVNLAKVAVDRPRPAETFAGRGVEIHVPLGTPRDRSFPSGHTETATAAAVYLAGLYPTAAPIFLGLAALVGVSRIALGVHFPADVLVGALIGVAVALLGLRIGRSREARHPPPPQ